MMRFLVSWIVLFVMWMAFVASLDPQEIVTGLVVGFFATFVSRASIVGEQPAKWLSPKRWFYFILYTFYFIKELTVANLDVAYRVIHPKLPINPGIVRVKTKLKSPMAKLVLANSITMTPGTITVDINDDTLYIHWIDVQGKDVEEATRAIVEGFEKYLEVIFE